MINTPNQVDEKSADTSERSPQIGSNATSLADLTQILESHTDTPVRFLLNGESIQPGYHVTEIKYANVQSIDCGHGTDQWNELIIQLLDGHQHSKGGLMSSNTLLKLISAASNSLPMTTAFELYIEFAPHNGAMMKLAIDSLNYVPGQSSDTAELQIVLGTQRAICKPFHRSLNANTSGTEHSENGITSKAY